MLAKSTVRWKNLFVHSIYFFLCSFEECCFLFLFHDYAFLLLYPQGWCSSLLPPCEIKGAFLKSQKFLRKTFFVWNPKFSQKVGIIFRWELDPPPSQIWARPPTQTSGDTRQRHFPLQHQISRWQIYLNFRDMRVLFFLDISLLPYCLHFLKLVHFGINRLHLCTLYRWPCWKSWALFSAFLGTFVLLYLIQLILYRLILKRVIVSH